MGDSISREKQQKELYDFDEEELRPYFPVDRVIDGLFDLAQKVFNLRIGVRQSFEVGSSGEVPEGAAEVWHPEVKYYDMFDATNGRNMGSFFILRHSREPQAWWRLMNTELVPLMRMVTYHLTLVSFVKYDAICGDRPSITHSPRGRDNFHEFGHLIHHLCGEVEIRRLNGVNVAWDFVELPFKLWRMVPGRESSISLLVTMKPAK